MFYKPILLLYLLHLESRHREVATLAVFSDAKSATFAVVSNAKFATFAVFSDTEFATLVRDLRIWNV